MSVIARTPAPRRRASQPRAGPRGRPSGLRRARPRRADGRRGAPRRRRRRHRLPPLPDQGGAARGARARLFEQVAARRPARRSELEDPWEAFTPALWAGAEVLASDRALHRDRRPGRDAVRVGAAARRCSRVYAELDPARAKDRVTCAPDIVLDDIPMFMCGIGMATMQAAPCPDAWRRHLAIMHRRPARRERLRPAAVVASGGMSAPETVSDPELQEVAWDLSDLLDGAAAATRRPASTRCSPTRRPAPTRSPTRTPARSPSSTAPASSPPCASSARSRRSPAAPAPTRTSPSRPTPPTPANGALLQRVQEKGTAIETALLFFHLEWAALDDARADELLATDGLDFARHHLRTARRYRPHLLSEPEEKILAEKALSGRSAWARLFEEQTAAITVELPTAPSRCRWRSRSSRLFTPDREVRQDAAERVTAALQPGLRTRAYAFNTLLADKMVDDRLRAYPHWLAARNLSNEASDESVQALIEAVRARYELPRRWYRLKAQLLGHRPARGLRPHGRRHAGQREGRLARGQARSCRTPTRRSPASSASSSTASSTSAGSTAPVRPGKRGGAFCSYGVPSRAPVRDAQLHAPAPRRADARARARPRRARRARRAAGRLPHGDAADAGRDRVACSARRSCSGACSEAAPTPESRLSLLAESIEGSIATVFRQVAMNRFEHLIHTAAPRGGRARASTASASCGRSRRRSCSATRSRSPRATAPGGPTSPTSSASPGYVYAYAYGQLLALAVYGRYEEEGEAFVPAYLDLLQRRRLEVARGARRRSSASTSPTRASGTRAWTSSSASSTRPSRPRATPAGSQSVAARARTIVRATAGELVDGDALVDRVRELDAASCRPSPPGCRARVNRRMSAPHGTPASARPRRARRAARRGTVATHGWSARRLAGRERAALPGDLAAAARRRRARRRRTACSAARAAVEVARRRGTPRRPSNSTRSGTWLDHSPPSTRPTQQRVGQRELAHQRVRDVALTRALVRREREVHARRSGRSPSGPRGARRRARRGRAPSPRKVSAPACAQTTSKPVGSGISAASKAASRSSAANVPRPPSSSERDAPAARPRASLAPVAQRGQRVQRGDHARPSCRPTPRPCSRPSSTAPDHGPCATARVPGPTTSTWPLSAIRRGAPPGSVAVSAPQLVARAPPRPGGPGARAGRRGRARAGRRPARARAARLGEQLERRALVAGDARHAHERGGVAGERVRDRVRRGRPPPFVRP